MARMTQTSIGSRDKGSKIAPNTNIHRGAFCTCRLIAFGKRGRIQTFGEPQGNAPSRLLGLLAGE
jgi:hypothetical protein